MVNMGEFDFIKLFAEGEAVSHSEILQGIGDDCAIFRGNAGRDWLISVDAFVEGVHFKREWCKFEDIGRKALAVNLSDVAAMGGKPLFFLVSLGVPKDVDDSNVLHLYDGMKSIAREYDVFLAGGDTVLSLNGISLSITIIGEVETAHGVLRSGASVGDHIYVSGMLGEAALGFRSLKNCRNDNKFAEFRRKFFNPIPRFDVSKLVSKYASSMIDISDGLLADLSHVADASNLGFEIDTSYIAMNEKFKKAADDLECNALETALTGGEDYELLFSISANSVDDFEKYVHNGDLQLDVSKIGRFVDDFSTRAVKDAMGRDIELDKLGYDHFLLG